MRAIQKLALTGTFLAATGLMTATPASGMFIMHNSDVLVADDLQSYTPGSAPGGPWSTSVTHGVNGAGAYNFARVFDAPSGTPYNYTAITGGGSESIGVLPGAPLTGHSNYIALFTGARAQPGSRTGSNWAANVNHAAQNSGVLNYEFMIYSEVNNAGRLATGDIRLGSEILSGQLYNGSTLGRARITWRSGGNELRIGSTNYSSNKTTSDGLGTGLFLSSNTWHKINISVDLDADLFAVAVDDQWSSAFSLAGSGAISAITFSHGLDQSHLFIGSTVPEPASLALIGLGSLLMLRRRRHAA
jgi:hypothetical protein